MAVMALFGNISILVPKSCITPKQQNYSTAFNDYAMQMLSTRRFINTNSVE